MSVTNGIISKTDVSAADIKSVFGLSDPIIFLLTHIAPWTANINKWSKNKPVMAVSALPNSYEATIEELKAAPRYLGFDITSIPKVTGRSNLVTISDTKAGMGDTTWKYKIGPDYGTSSTYIRLGDFAGYNHNAQCQFAMPAQSSMTVSPSSSLTFSVKNNYTASTDGLQIADIAPMIGGSISQYEYRVVWVKNANQPTQTETETTLGLVSSGAVTATYSAPSSAGNYIRYLCVHAKVNNQDTYLVLPNGRTAVTIGTPISIAMSTLQFVTSGSTLARINCIFKITNNSGSDISIVPFICYRIPPPSGTVAQGYTNLRFYNISTNGVGSWKNGGTGTVSSPLLPYAASKKITIANGTTTTVSYPLANVNLAFSVCANYQFAFGYMTSATKAEFYRETNVSTTAAAVWTPFAALWG